MLTELTFLHSAPCVGKQIYSLATFTTTTLLTGVGYIRVEYGSAMLMPSDILCGGGGKVKHEKWATHQPPSTSKGVVDRELRDDDMMIL